MANVTYEGKWSDLLWSGGHATPQSVDQAFELAVKSAGGDLLGAVASCSWADGETRWQVVAVSGKWLVVLNASAPVDDWTRDSDAYRSGGQSYLNLDGQNISVRLLPVTSVAGLELTDPIGKRVSQLNNERKLLGQWTIVLPEEKLTLPVAHPYSNSDPDPATDLVQAIAQKLP